MDRLPSPSGSTLTEVSEGRQSRTYSEARASVSDGRQSRTYSEDIDIVGAAAALDRKNESRRGSWDAQDEDTKTLYKRAFSPLTAGGVRQSIFTLVQTALGGGVLTISYMLRLSGWCLGLCLLVLSGLVAIVGMHIIMRSAVELRTYTFSGLLSKCLGNASGIFLDVSLFFYGNGSCIAYFVFLGDFIPDLVVGTWNQANSVPDPEKLRTTCLLVTLIPVVFLCLPKELSALRYVSPLALAGILYTVLVVVHKMPGLFSRVNIDEIEFINFDGLERNIFKCFSMCIFAYNCHINVVPVAEELDRNTQDHKRTRPRILKITSRVAGVQLALYVLLSLGGYLSFAGKTPSNLLTAYPDNDPLIVLSRVLLSITIAVAIPTSVNPTVRSLLNLCERCFPSLREEEEPIQGGKLQPLLSGALVVPPEAKPRWSLCRESLRKFFAIGCCFGQCMVAVEVRNVATVIGILGATVSTLMMMVVPLLLIHRACPKLYPDSLKWFFTALLSLSIAMTFPTLFMS